MTRPPAARTQFVVPGMHGSGTGARVVTGTAARGKERIYGARSVHMNRCAVIYSVLLEFFFFFAPARDSDLCCVLYIAPPTFLIIV